MGVCCRTEVRLEPREFLFSLGLLFPYCLSMVIVRLISAHILRTVHAGGGVGGSHPSLQGIILMPGGPGSKAV